jgi:acetyl-CoA C-acetyltransferase
MSQIHRVCIVDGSRIPFAKSGTAYLGKSNKELMTFVLKDLVKKCQLSGVQLGEVTLGAVSKHQADWNMARNCVMDSGLSPRTPAYDLQRACGTSLEAALNIANKIALGIIDSGIAAGVDTNGDVPIEFSKKFSDRLLRLNGARTTMDKLKALKGFSPAELAPVLPSIFEPKTGLSMGQSCEIMAKNWNVSRSEQDELAAKSHENAAKAYDEGFYGDSVASFNGLDKDNILRPGTTVEKLAKLRHAFDKSDKGTLTAGNSSALTDGASAVLLCNEDFAKKHNLKVLAYLKTGQAAGVDYVNDEGLLMAPVYAVSEMLERVDMKLQDFDFYEIHEAFAAQVLCTLKAWEDEKFCKEKLGRDEAMGSIDLSKLNVKGSSLALGHPFAATGSRIVHTLAKLLDQKGSGKGLISICTAGGMGVCAIVERD